MHPAFQLLPHKAETHHTLHKHFRCNLIRPQRPEITLHLKKPMKSTIKTFTAFLLGLLLSCPWPTFLPVQAQSLKDLRTQQQATKPSKFAPDLEVLLADDDEEQRHEQDEHGGLADCCNSFV